MYQAGRVYILAHEPFYPPQLFLKPTTYPVFPASGSYSLNTAAIPPYPTQATCFPSLYSRPLKNPITRVLQQGFDIPLWLSLHSLPRSAPHQPLPITRIVPQVFGTAVWLSAHSPPRSSPHQPSALYPTHPGCS